MITVRKPLVPPLGGGIPFGGTKHAGHADWMEVMNPKAAAPEKPFTMPQPSEYATPTPREAPSIVTKKFKLLRGMGRAIGGPLDDGYSRIPVVGEEGAAVQLMNSDINMKLPGLNPFTGYYRQARPQFKSETSVRVPTAKSNTTTNVGVQMDVDRQSNGPVNQETENLANINLDLEPMDDDVFYDTVGKNEFKLIENVGGGLTVQSTSEEIDVQNANLKERLNALKPKPPTTMVVYKEQEKRVVRAQPRMNTSENTFNMNPTSTKEELADALVVTNRQGRFSAKSLSELSSNSDDKRMAARAKSVSEGSLNSEDQRNFARVEQITNSNFKTMMRTINKRTGKTGRPVIFLEEDMDLFPKGLRKYYKGKTLQLSAIDFGALYDLAGRLGFL
jgi:hypothetical protein